MGIKSDGDEQISDAIDSVSESDESEKSFDFDTDSE